MQRVGPWRMGAALAHSATAPTARPVSAISGSSRAKPGRDCIVASWPAVRAPTAGDLLPGSREGRTAPAAAADGSQREGAAMTSADPASILLWRAHIGLGEAGRAPQPHGTVAAGTGQDRAVGREGHRSNWR